MDEKRVATRYNISFPVECKNLPSRNYFYTVSKNLSVSGVKILINKFIPKNNLLKININLIDKVLDLKAQVIWCNQERVADKFSAGLRFLEISDLTRSELTNFLDKINS